MIKFDKNKIELRIGSPNYFVQYFICRVPGNAINFTVEEMKKRKYRWKENVGDRACFAALKRMLGNFRGPGYLRRPANRVLYKCQPKNSNVIKRLHLSDKEIERWVTLCKQNRLMPKNIGKHFLETMCFIVDLEKVSKDRLYMYLTAARYIQEMPAFVRAVLHLVDDVGLDFFIAFSKASQFSSTNSGHHILPISRDYQLTCFTGDMNDTKVDAFNKFNLKHAAQLAKFAFKTTVKETPITEFKGVPYFKLHEQLGSIKVNGEGPQFNSFIVHKNHILKKEVIKAVRSGDLKSIQKYKE